MEPGRFWNALPPNVSEHVTSYLGNRRVHRLPEMAKLARLDQDSKRYWQMELHRPENMLAKMLDNPVVRDAWTDFMRWAPESTASDRTLLQVVRRFYDARGGLEIDRKGYEELMELERMRPGVFRGVLAITDPLTPDEVDNLVHRQLERFNQKVLEALVRWGIVDPNRSTWMVKERREFEIWYGHMPDEAVEWLLARAHQPYFDAILADMASTPLEPQRASRLHDAGYDVTANDRSDDSDPGVEPTWFTL